MESLKKENFNLQLKVFYLVDKLAQVHLPQSTHDLLTQIVDLQVLTEEQTRELQKKNELLQIAKQTITNLKQLPISSSSTAPKITLSAEVQTTTVETREQQVECTLGQQELIAKCKRKVAKYEETLRTQIQQKRELQEQIDIITKVQEQELQIKDDQLHEFRQLEVGSLQWVEQYHTTNHSLDSISAALDTLPLQLFFSNTQPLRALLQQWKTLVQSMEKQQVELIHQNQWEKAKESMEQQYRQDLQDMTEKLQTKARLLDKALLQLHHSHSATQREGQWEEEEELLLSLQSQSPISSSSSKTSSTHSISPSTALHILIDKNMSLKEIQASMDRLVTSNQILIEELTNKRELLDKLRLRYHNLRNENEESKDPVVYLKKKVKHLNKENETLQTLKKIESVSNEAT